MNSFALNFFKVLFVITCKSGSFFKEKNVTLIKNYFFCLPWYTVCLIYCKICRSWVVFCLTWKFHTGAFVCYTSRNLQSNGRAGSPVWRILIRLCTLKVDYTLWQAHWAISVKKLTYGRFFLQTHLFIYYAQHDSYMR